MSYFGALIMAYKHLQRLFVSHKNKKTGAWHLNFMHYHCAENSAHQELLTTEWYEKAFRKIKKLSCSLKNVDLIDGRLVNMDDDSTITDERMEQRMRTLKSFVRVFVGSPSAQRKITERAISTAANSQPYAFFSNPSEREPMVVDSLTKISNFLNVSAQQRKLVRHTISPQVTQHRIWIGALEKMLKELRFELNSLANQSPNKAIQMGQQIVSSCLKFLDDATISNAHSTSWMRPVPSQVVGPSASPRWDDMLEMFNDLIGALKDEKWLIHHVTKLEVIKEGLAQIRDVITDKSIGFKDVRNQESLVQKKLSKALGHSSKCLFTLLLYYLCGQIRDLEVDLCGGVLKFGDGHRFLLFMGRILSSEEEKMVWNGVRQLDRAMVLLKFVWETAGMKGGLELQGHLWCFGAQERQLSYKGNVYILHEISM